MTLGGKFFLFFDIFSPLGSTTSTQNFIKIPKVRFFKIVNNAIINI